MLAGSCKDVEIHKLLSLITRGVGGRGSLYPGVMRRFP